MLKKLVISLALLAATAVAVPAHADPNDGCMLSGGCFFASDPSGGPGHWVCPDPGTYALCDTGG